MEIINMGNGIDIIVPPKKETIESIKLDSIRHEYQTMQKRNARRKRRTWRYKLMNSIGLL